MGDSITFGRRATADGGHDSSGGYRRYLRRSLLDAGKTFELVGACPGFVGRCQIPPNRTPPILPAYCASETTTGLGHHDGHPGWDINAFRARMGYECPGSIENYLSRVVDDDDHRVMPHIVLLMVGANDVRAGSGIREGAALRFSYLLDELLTALPSTSLLVVGLVTPNLVGTNNRDGVIPFNRAVTNLVRAHRDAGRNVRLVNTYSAIRITSSGDSPDLSPDDLHPNERGYQAIAARWYDAIAPLVR
jgi:lysophospholipase L1-like esterase